MDEISVGKLADIPDGDYRVFAVDEFEVGIFRTGSKVLAYENSCPHAGGPICQGKIFNKVEEVITPDKKSAGLRFGKSRHIVCPWHGYEYDLATGCHPGDPSVRLTPVKVSVREGQIYISLPERSRRSRSSELQDRCKCAEPGNQHDSEAHGHPQRYTIERGL